MPSAHTSPKFERTSCSDLETWLILAANQFKCRWLFSRCCLLRRRQQRRLQLSFCFILFCSVFCCLCITPFFVWHFSHIWVGKHYSRSRVSLNGILQKNPIRVVRVIKTGKASAHVHLVWIFFFCCLCVVFVFLFYFPFRYHFRLVNFESTNKLLLPSLPHCQALGWAFTILYIGHMGHLMHMSATIMKSNLSKATAPASPWRMGTYHLLD